MFKKIISILVLFMLLTGVLLACGEKNQTPTSPSDNESTSTTPPGRKPNNKGPSKNYYEDYERDDLPETLNYSTTGVNKDFSILCDNSQYPKSFVEKDPGDVINTALFERKSAVETRLGVNIKITREQGAYNDSASFIQKMIAAHSAGASFDLILAYNLTPAIIASGGYAQKLGNAETTKWINFEKPWWSPSLLENTQINGNIYFTADNSSWNNLRNMLGIFVNEDLLADKTGIDINDLYKLVEDKEWTFDKMFELTKNTYESKSGTGTPSETDIYGFAVGNTVWQEAWFFAAGFTVVENVGGELKFSYDLGSKVSDFLDAFMPKYRTTDNFGADPAQYKMFLGGNAMFYLSALSMVEQKIAVNYGVVPMPVYEQGADYRTHFSNTYDMYCIPLSCGDSEMSSAVFECLASEAFRRIGPAYFESFLKLQNSNNPKLSEMYDMIRAGIVFDTGVLYGEFFKTDSGAADNPVYYVRRVINSASSSGANFSSSWESVREKYNGVLKKEIYDKLS